MLILAFVFLSLTSAILLGDLTEVFSSRLVLLYFAAALSFILIGGSYFSGGNIRSVFICVSKDALTFILSLFLITVAVPCHNTFVEQNPISVLHVFAFLGILIVCALRLAVRYFLAKHLTVKAAPVYGMGVQALPGANDPYIYFYPHTARCSRFCTSVLVCLNVFVGRSRYFESRVIYARTLCRYQPHAVKIRPSGRRYKAQTVY